MLDAPQSFTHGEPGFAFIKSGSFSHANPRILNGLRAAFPGYAAEEIDLWSDILQRNRRSFLIGCLQAIAFYGRHVAANPRSLRFAALRTPSVFRSVRRTIGQRLERSPLQLKFSFQTQSLFDASVPGLPHFVFSDHTHLANLQYPAFRRSDLYPRRWTNLEREIYANAQHVFAMSGHVGRSVQEDYGIAPSRVSVVYAGGNLDSSQTRLENRDFTNQTVVFVGVDWERKGGPTLLAAFRTLRSRLPDAKLIVVGCSPAANEPWCEEVGRIPSDQVKDHLRRASAFCLPTRIEPFGFAVVEALSMGLPAVVSKIGAMPSLVRDGETGRIVPVDDPPALAAALEELLTQPAKCRTLGVEGRRDMLERCTWPKVMERIGGVIAKTVPS